LILFFFILRTIEKKRIKKYKKEEEISRKFWEEKNRRKKKLEEIFDPPEIKKEPSLSQVVETPCKALKKYVKNTIVSGKKAYRIEELSELDRGILLKDGFTRVEQTNIDGKKQTYIVFEDKFESPRHIISVKEIVDYLKLFTKEITTYKTAMPDIVFEANKKKYAIEVETGTIIRDKKKMQNKIELLKERFEDNWFFFVTNRNLEKKYSKLGETSTKRNIKFKIRQIFKNSKKMGKSATRKNLGGKSQSRR
jgi:hypothetical protein